MRISNILIEYVLILINMFYMYIYCRLISEYIVKYYNIYVKRYE